MSVLGELQLVWLKLVAILELLSTADQRDAEAAELLHHLTDVKVCGGAEGMG